MWDTIVTLQKNFTCNMQTQYEIHTDKDYTYICEKVYLSWLYTSQKDCFS